VVAAVAALAVVGVLLGDRIATGLGLAGGHGAPPLASGSATAAASQPSKDVGQVEVPDLTGMGLVSAEVLLEAAGLTTEVRLDTALTPGVDQRVARQNPPCGAVVPVGTRVVLDVPRSAAVKRASVKAHLPRKYTVVLDPGHQSIADSRLESVGPGAQTTAPRSSAGGVGVATRIPEYELTRQLAAGLEDRLSARGVKVVLTRSTNDVNLSESERAVLANRVKADLLLSIHLRSNQESEAVGICALYPAVNRWTKARSTLSRRAAEAIVDLSLIHISEPTRPY
jgi:N-acetylmuramoyl-L-alanine amidase